MTTTAGFFLSIPDAVRIRDVDEEVFELFTTETIDSPWSHNRSVAQKETLLELELDFTPVSSPRPFLNNSQNCVNAGSASAPNLTNSRPGSKPGSRPGSRPESRGCSSTANIVEQNERDDADLLTDPSFNSQETLGKNSPVNSGSKESMVLTHRKPSSPMTATSPTTTPTVSVAKALLGSRQQRKMSKRPNSGPVSRTAASPTSPSSPTIPTVSGLGSGSGLGSTRVQAPQPKKPIVIHQSLSTLSKPGQTGTVVWDSSIMMAKFLLSIRGLTTNCYAQSIQHRRHRRRSRRQDRSAGNDDSNSNDGTAKETRIKGSAQMQSKAEGEGERVGLQKDAIRKLEEQAEHMIVSENGELLDTLPKLNCGQDLRGELDQDQNIEQAAKGTFVGSGSDSSDGSDYDDEEEDNDEREDANGEGDEGQGRLVFNSAETTILELGSGCGLLGIVMAELCQDLLLTDQSPVLPLLIKNLRKNLDKKYFDRQDGLTSSLSGFAGDGSSSTGGVTSGLTMAESGSLSKAGKKGGRSGKKGSTGNGEDSSVTSARPCLIQVQELVWGQDLDQDLQRGLGVDFVIATDVVYNESVVPKLIQTLEELCQVRERAREGIQSRCGRDYERFLALEESREEDFRSLQAAKGGRSSQGVEAGERQRRRTLDKTVILIAQELRTNYVHQAFIEGLDRAGFVMVRMPQELIDIDYQAGYVIYACFLRSDRTGARIVAI